MANRSVTEILSTLNVATADFVEDVVTQLYNDNYLSQKLMKNSKAAEGKYVTFPLKYGREHTQTMSQWDEYNFQPNEILDEARYEWKHVHGDMVLSRLQLEAQNVGTAKIIDLARTKAENMTESLQHQFSVLLFTAVADLGANDPDSLIKIVATQNNTVGGINASTETRFTWNPTVLDWSSHAVTYADLTDPDGDHFIEKMLRKIVSPLTVGTMYPDIGLASQVVWDAYEESLRADKRFDDHYEADAGFETLRFRRMKIAVDSHVPGGKLNDVTDGTAMFFVLNSKYLGYRHSPRVNFDWTKWTKSERQPVYFSMLDWMGSFGCSRRDCQGSVLGLPTDNEVYSA